jgi:two-component system chemotaxis response regulator CheB
MENRFARGVGNMEQLEKIASPSTFTPGMPGHAVELHGQQPQRFRCHTGHGFTAKILGEVVQHDKAEAAIWAAVRALQEKERLYLDLAAKAHAWLHPGAASEYGARARQAREQADAFQADLAGLK